MESLVCFLCIECGIANDGIRYGRLLGGNELQPFEFPWLVNIRVKGLLSIPGTILNNRYIITAASSMIGYVII